MFVIAIVELVIASSVTCKETLLWESCEVETPFCGTMFNATCNCAVLNVRKHNWTEFPKELFEMDALKSMKINHGPLQEIPNNINTKFDKVSELDFSFIMRFSALQSCFYFKKISPRLWNYDLLSFLIFSMF